MGTLDELTAVVDQPTASPVATMSDAALRAELFGLCGALDRIEHRVATLSAAADRRALAWADGHGSTPAWIQAKTGTSRRDAKALLSAGLALDSLPLVDKAWAQGEISTSAATTITTGRRAQFSDEYAAIESTLVGFAAEHRWRELRACVAEYQALCDALDDREPSDRDGVYLDQVGNRWALTGDLCDDAGATIDRALKSAMAGELPGDARDPAKRRADALVEIARYYTDHAGLPMEDGRVPHLSIGFDLPSFRDSLPCPIRVWDGPHASIAQMARLACEAAITAMPLDPDGAPLSMGREIRDANRQQRRAIARRDGGCRFPGCDRPTWRCHPHHVHWWDHGGPTNIDNLVCLCAFHHGVVHRKGWNTTFDGIIFTVFRDGKIIGQTPNQGIPPPAPPDRYCR